MTGIIYFVTTVSRKLDFPPNRGLCCRQCRNKDSTILVFWLPTTEGGRFTDLQSVRSSCSWRRFKTSAGSVSCCSTNEKHHNHELIIEIIAIVTMKVGVFRNSLSGSMRIVQLISHTSNSLECMGVNGEAF